MDILSERLRILRDERHISREAAAKAVGVVVRTYQRYENGEREPDATTLRAMADFFQVSADFLLGRTDIRGSENPPFR